MFLAPTSRAKYAWAPSCRQSNERNLSLKQHCLQQLKNASEFFSNSMKRGSARCAAVTVSRSTHHGSASAERRVSVLEARMSKTQRNAFCIGGSSPPNAQRDSLAPATPSISGTKRGPVPKRRFQKGTFVKRGNNWVGMWRVDPKSGAFAALNMQ
jgi:hypothetical protein